jgi:hypothetical protein
MMTGGDDTVGNDNGDDSVSVRTFSPKQMPIQIQAKLNNRLLLKGVTEELMLTDTHY